MGRFAVVIALVLSVSGSVYALGPDWVGKPAPEFTLRTLDGNTQYSLKDLRGQVVVIDFWASWCAPCKRSLPKLAELQKGLKGVRVVAINIDDQRSNGLSFLSRNKVDLTALFDKDKSVAKLYDVPEMPSALVVDKKGVVHSVYPGYGEDAIGTIRNDVERLLKGIQP